MDHGDAADLYLDLLKGCLLRQLFAREQPAALWPDEVEPHEREVLDAVAERTGGRLYRIGFDPQLRHEGKDWPTFAETMVGRVRLDHLDSCVRTVLQEDVPGDLLEAGVWRGGASILMRGVLAAFGDLTRRVWCADSFEGMPRPDLARWPADEGLDLTDYAQLAIPLESVKANFSRYGLLDDRVVFLAGWFEETLTSAPVDELAVLRVDGDLYGSVMVTLEALYDRVAPGGFVIVDDYGCLDAARQATDDFRDARGITEPIQTIDWTGAFWRRRG